MSAVIVIPARYGSTRLPGKPLLEIRGKPLIQWVYERACEVPQVKHVVVATDDSRIEECVRSFGGGVAMTSLELPSGTDRMAEVAKEYPAEFYVNWQGDEPLLEPEAVAQVIEALRKGAPMVSLMAPLRTQDLEDASVVKVVTDQAGRALYFSRFGIPHSRVQPSERPVSFQHVGVYGFAANALSQFVSLPQAETEKAESLEQLRALENGIPIQMIEIESSPVGIDTLEDLEKIKQIMENQPHG